MLMSAAMTGEKVRSLRLREMNTPGAGAIRREAIPSVDEGY